MLDAGQTTNRCSLVLSRVERGESRVTDFSLFNTRYSVLSLARIARSSGERKFPRFILAADKVLVFFLFHYPD
jgi:hypothetical protein